MAAHAKLGASSAKRWMTCPGSIRLIDKVPAPRESVYARQGTIAHALAEYCLEPLVLGRKQAMHVRQAVIPFVLAWADDHDGEDIDDVVDDDDMIAAVQTYVDWVEREFGPEIRDGRYSAWLEQRLSLEAFADISPLARDMFGTVDLLVFDRKTRRLWVVDYKHGQGIAVEVHDNEQTLYYALAATSVTGVTPADVTAVIVQPRAIHSDGAVRMSTTSVTSLAEFAGRLLDAADQTADPNAPLVSGEHCRFCPAAAVCPRLAEDRLRDAEVEFTGEEPRIPGTVELLTAAELVRVLKAKPLIEAWLNEVERFAHRRLEEGDDVTGGEFKLVAKRAVRKWAQDDDATADVLCEEYGLGDEDMFKRVLRTPADLEKKIPRDKREAFKKLIVAESSGTTLAHASDKRPAVSPSTPADEFTSIPD